MVGDVKQSIYRFRLAMPQIFMAKKDSYTLTIGCTRRSRQPLRWIKTSAAAPVCALM